MTEPVQLLKKRYLEICECYERCKENNHDLKKIGKLKAKYSMAITVLTAKGFKTPKHHPNHVAINHKNGVLGYNEILDIRENCILGLHKKRKFGCSYFAEKYGVSRETVRRVKQGKTYQNLDKLIN